MKIPALLNKYCAHCRTYTPHTVKIYKKGSDSPLAQGARRYARKKKGYGSSPKPIQKKKVKVVKKVALVLECKQCKHKMMTIGKRMKKSEIKK
ncbi:MAG: 50S ribosomal protein L44e [Candidatus Korarchaeota archaeon]